MLLWVFFFHCLEAQEDNIVENVNGEKNGNNTNSSSIFIWAQNCLFTMFLRMWPGQVNICAMCSGKARNMDCLLIYLCNKYILSTCYVSTLFTKLESCREKRQLCPEVAQSSVGEMNNKHFILTQWHTALWSCAEDDTESPHLMESVMVGKVYQKKMIT